MIWFLSFLFSSLCTFLIAGFMQAKHMPDLWATPPASKILFLTKAYRPCLQCYLVLLSVLLRNIGHFLRMLVNQFVSLKASKIIKQNQAWRLPLLWALYHCAARWTSAVSLQRSDLAGKSGQSDHSEDQSVCITRC
jgi:hypothetical protein